MAEYRRWIARIYSYEKGIKKSLSGYAWLETYDGELRLKVEVKVPGTHEKMVPVYFFKRHKNGLQGIRLGELNIQSGNGKFYFVTPCQNISRSGLHFLEMNGIVLYMDALHYFGSQWDEKPITQKGVLTLEDKMPKEEGQIWFEEVIRSINDRLQDGEDIVRAASVETSMKRGMNVESNLVNSRRISVSEQSMTVEEARKRHEERMAARQKKSSAAIELTTERDKGEVQKRQEVRQKEEKERSAKQKKEAALAAEENRKKEEKEKEEARQKEAARQLEIKRQKEAERQQEEARQKEQQRILKEEEKRQEEKRAWEEAKLAAQAAKKQEDAYMAEEMKVTEKREAEKAVQEKRTAERAIEEEKKIAEEQRVKEEQQTREEREKKIEENVQQAKAADKRLKEEERLATEKEEEDKWAEEARILEQRRQEEEQEQTAEEVRRINAIKRFQEIAEREEAIRQGMRQQPFEAEEEEDTNVQAAQVDYIEERNEPRTGMFPWMDVPQARSILDSHSHMYPFEDGEIAECVRIEPNDIGMFPMDAWTLGNNSFIRHAFFNYRHLLFAKKQVRDGCLYLLMVPGVYNPREKHMARMFGFDCFKCVNRKNLRIGEFGYWYLPINFQ